MGITKNGEAGADFYAKSGSLRICVNQVGSDLIKEGAFVFGYGHSTYNISVGLALPASFSIGFTSGSTTMVQKAVRMTSSGTIIEY